jgi:hypothetical protein
MESRIWFQIWFLKKLVLDPKMRANLDSRFFLPKPNLMVQVVLASSLILEGTLKLSKE